MVDFDLVDVKIIKWKYRWNQDERGGNCVYMFTYTHAGCKFNKHADRKGGQTYDRFMCTTRAPCQRYALNSQEKKKENKNVIMNTKPNTNHADLATQVERQVEKKAYTHDTDS